MSSAFKNDVDRARAYVEKIPGAEEGNHGDNQTLAVANVLIWDFALIPADALMILSEYNSRCSPPWTEAELVRKLQSAERQPHSKPRGNLCANKFSAERVSGSKRNSTTKKEQSNPIASVESFLKGFRCSEVDLWEASPVRPPDEWTQDALCLLECLFQPGELVNFVTEYRTKTSKDSTIKAKPYGYGTTMERNKLISHWRQHGMPRSPAGGWMRMNPVDGGGVGDANITALRASLVESDDLPLPLQLSVLAKIPLPIFAILASGGRSLHALVKTDAQDINNYRSDVARMLTLLSKFGFDDTNKNPSRLFRLPGVRREIGAIGGGAQRILYLNPNPADGSIL